MGEHEWWYMTCTSLMHVGDIWFNGASLTIKQLLIKMSCDFFEGILNKQSGKEFAVVSPNTLHAIPVDKQECMCMSLLIWVKTACAFPLIWTQFPHVEP